MLKVVQYWVLVLVAFLVLGPIAGSLVGDLRAADGLGHVTPFTAAHVSRGLLGGLGALAIAAVAGLVGARTLNARDGMTIAGIVVAWAAYRTGAPDDLIRRTQNAKLPWSFAMEGLIFGACGIVLCLLIAAAEKTPSVADAPSRRDHEHAARWTPEAFAAVGFATLGGVVGGGLIAWLLALQSLKLQCIAAAAGAAIVAGGAGQLILAKVPHSMPTFRRAVFCGALATAILATLGPITAFAATKDAGGLLRSAYDGNYFAPASPLALDWIAGALLGLPLGLSSTASRVEHRHKSHRS